MHFQKGKVCSCVQACLEGVRPGVIALDVACPLCTKTTLCLRSGQSIIGNFKYACTADSRLHSLEQRRLLCSVQFGEHASHKNNFWITTSWVAGQEEWSVVTMQNTDKGKIP